ncbi:MAG: hypothetical protein AB9842_07700 [Bacteroidales bacterium]
MNIFTRKRFLFLTVLSFSVILFSCEKFSGDQTIPAYIHIEQISLTVGDLEGTASHKITDAWVYIDNRLIGAFQLPVTFPVLKKGKQTLIVYAGIKMNGISSTRVYYPFYKPVEYELELVEDSVISLSPVVSYYENTDFVWMEDFEAGGSSFEKTAKSDTSIVLTSDIQNVFEGNYSGLVSMNDSVLLFEAATMNSYELPKTGSSVFLEMNYKTNNIFTVGIIGVGATQVIQQPILVVNHSASWNKIYINLTSTLQQMTSSVEFKVFIGALKEDTVVKPVILVDNFKLLTFK